MPSIPPELIDEFSNGNGSIFVGAGLSIGAGLPSWTELVTSLAAELEGCPEGSSHIDTAQYYVNAHKRRRLMSRLRKELNEYGARPTEVHKTLVRLPFVRRFFTTNFDSLLEEALQERGSAFQIIVNSEDLSSLDNSQTQVIKLHGDLRYPNSIVFTSDDYENYSRRHPTVARFLENEFLTQTVLFLGYSFTDIDSRMIHSNVAQEIGEARRAHFIVRVNPSEPDVIEFQRRGIEVIRLQVDAPPGDVTPALQTRALHTWLEEFALCLRERAERAAAARVHNLPQPPAATIKVTNNNLPPRFGDLVGRKNDFDRVMEALKSRWPLITIEGFAGTGKTSLAMEVGYACATNGREAVSGAIPFAYVVWISAKDNPDQKHWLDHALNVIGVTTNFSAITQQPIDKLDQKKLQVDGLLRSQKILLIVDNYETIDDPELMAWLERIPEPSKVIITTKDIQRHQKAWSVNLRGLGPKDACTMLRKHAARIGLEFVDRVVSDETLLELSRVTGGNPQAMKLALGLVKGGTVDFWELINHLDEGSPTPSIDNVFRDLFLWSWGLLTENAKKILLVTPLFVGVSSIQKDALKAATGLLDFDEGLTECVGFGLLEVNYDNRRFVIHPMTRTFVGTQLNKHPEWKDEARRRCSEYFLGLVRRSVIRENPKPRYWNALVSGKMDAIDPEWPSIHEVMKWADQEGQDSLLVELVMLLVHYMDSRFLNLERLSYVRKAVDALHRMKRKEDEALLRIDAKEYEALLRIDALGWTYVEENLLEEAYAEIQKGLEIAAGLEKEEEKQDLLALGFAWQARTKMEEDLSEEAEKLIRKALSMKCRPWIRYRVHMAAGDIDLKEGNSAGALSHYEDAEKEMKEYGIEGHSYQIGPRIGLAYLGVRRYKEAEQKFDELRAFEPIAIGKLYAEYGLALVALEKGKTQHARRLIAEVKTKLSRRTNSNLLLKLIESQEAKLARPVRRAGASKVSSHRRPGPTAGSPP